MNRIKFLFFIAMILFANVRCMEEKSTSFDLDSTAVHDSVDVTIAAEQEKDLIKPRKYIYLTIDDVPTDGSAYIDSIVTVEKVKTNLFLVGSHINGSRRFLRYYESLQNNPYIEMYNHSYSHANNKYANFYKNPELVLADFEKNQAEFGITHKIARLPGRNLWMVGERKKNCRQTGTTAAEFLAENGYEIFGWDVEWGYNPKDYTPEQSVDELIKKIEDIYHSSMTFTPNHIVLLIHNQMFRKISDKNNLQELINELRRNDFTFEYLSTY